MVLGETKLLERDASGDLDLSGDNVDTGDLLGDGVLDLDTRVDLDEVVPVLLVDQELGGTGVSVSDGVSEFQGVVQDGLSDRLVQVRSWGDLDDLEV